MGGSIRLGYAIQTGGPRPDWGLKELTRVFEDVFRRWLTEFSVANKDQTEPIGHQLSVVGCASLADVSSRNPVVVQALVDDLWQVSLSVTRAWPSEVKQRGRQQSDANETEHGK